MSYKQQIRQAHIAALRQRYLDIIDEAKQEREEKQKQYESDVRQAYIDKMNGLRDRPQYIRSLGMSGGVEELDLEGLTMDYQTKMDDYKRTQREFIDAYNRVVTKQNRLMQQAVDEYNAKTALEDYNEALAAQKTASKSTNSGRSYSRSASGGSASGGKTTSAASGGSKTSGTGKTGYVNPAQLMNNPSQHIKQGKTYILNWKGR